VARLGRGALEGLSFLEEHVAVDAGHTKFNALELERLLDAHPTFLEPLVASGSEALECYGAFMDDCLTKARAVTQRPAA
jgi:hypothetical protein